MQSELRTPEERIRAMHSRAAELGKQQEVRRARVISAIAAGASFAAVIIMAIAVSGVSGIISEPGNGGDFTGSILSGSPALGYIVVGIVAFMLGAAVTALGIRINRLNKENSGEDGL